MTDYIRGLAESRSLIWEMVGDQAEHQAQIWNDRFNRSLKDIMQYKIGALVWLEQSPTTTFISQDDHEKHKVKKAFRTRYTGPFSVLKRVSPITYILNVGGKPQHHTIDRMKPYHHRIANSKGIVDNGVSKGPEPEVKIEERVGDNAEGTTLMKRKRGRPRKEPLRTVVQSVQEVVRGRRKKVDSGNG